METEVPAKFAGWLALHLGTSKWVVARRSKRLVEKGYEQFLTQKRFTALKRYFEKENGEMENDSISQHLTEPDMDFAKRRKDTFSGMAFWASTGPADKTCRGCIHWSADGYMAGSGLLRDSLCTKYRALMHGQEGGRIPHYAKACKYFEETSDPRPLEKPRASTAGTGAVA